jgi:hypothetical protein
MRRLIAAGVAATAALIGLALPADAAAPTQTITAVCDTGTVTIKDYPANSKVIVRWKPYRGNFQTYWTKTVNPFAGDLTVVVKVPGAYTRYDYPWVISVEFHQGDSNAPGTVFTWGKPFDRC